MKIKYFKSASMFRRWLEVNHARARELWVGFYKKDSGKGGLIYAEAVDAVLGATVNSGRVKNVIALQADLPNPGGSGFT